MSKFAKVEEVLDGKDMNEDIGFLIGYCVSLGWGEEIMPSRHCSELAEEFLRKYKDEDES